MIGETVMLTGASGLLGTWLRRRTPPGVHVVSVVHRRAVEAPHVVADLRRRDAVEAAFATVTPSLVVHAAYAKDEASIVQATTNLADVGAQTDADLLLVSTDALFSGDGRPRDENATPDPVTDYGRWKAEAETIVTASDATSTIVRPSLIMSTDPEDHVISGIRSGLARADPGVWFTDEMRQPANADDLARAIWQIASLPARDREGVWHLPGPERLSRFEIACRVARAAGIDAGAVVGGPTPPGARRPRDLVLTSARADRQIDWSPSPIR